MELLFPRSSACTEPGPGLKSRILWKLMEVDVLVKSSCEGFDTNKRKEKRKGPTSLYLALLAVLVLMWQGVCRLHSPDLSLGHLLSFVALWFLNSFGTVLCFFSSTRLVSSQSFLSSSVPYMVEMVSQLLVQYLYALLPSSIYFLPLLPHKSFKTVISDLALMILLTKPGP